MVIGCNLFLLTDGIAANLSASPANSWARPLFYGGISLGVQRLSGARSEATSFTATIPADPEPSGVTIFSNRQPFSDKNGYYSGHLGCTWDIFHTAFFFGPEIYLGQSNTKSTLTTYQQDPNTGTNRTLSATIRQSTYLGGAIQVGVNWIANTRISFLLGLEASNFDYFGVYVPRSQTALNPLIGGPGVDYPPTLLKTSRWLSSVMWGFGLEKQIQSIRLGVDIRINQYRAFKSSYAAQALEPETLFSVIKPKNIRVGLKLSYII